MPSIARPQRQRPLADRLWAKVTRRGPDECWPWTGAICGTRRCPYGQIREGGSSIRKIGAHVAAFIVTYGPVPEGKEVCHTCDFSLCCNPAHIFAGTHKRNMADAKARGRMHGAGAPARGEDAGAAVLTEHQVLAIREAAAINVPQRLLADLCKVSQVAISMVVQRKTWAHITASFHDSVHDHAEDAA